MAENDEFKQLAQKFTYFKREQNKDKIWEEDAVTISFVNKAKGNEAHMVYVVGAEKVAMHENDIKLRNQLFVGVS